MRGQEAAFVKAGGAPGGNMERDSTSVACGCAWRRAGRFAEQTI